jgi:flagellar protein FliL
VVPAKGRRKLIVLAVSAALVASAGGAAWAVKKRRDAAAEALAAEEGGDGADATGDARHEARSGPPAFLPLESFVVNLTDRDSERYAQIGITLELDDAKHTDDLKAYMPAIRNGILMVLAHKSSQELLTRAGKEKLADEVMRAAVRPLGIDLADPADTGPDGAAVPRPGKTPLDESPVRHVHFSSFIIQ